MRKGSQNHGERPARRLHGLVIRFGRNRDGSTAVEFALLSVPFIALLFAIFETAFVFFINQGLEASVQDAARSIMTGQVQTDGSITSSTQFRDATMCSPVGKARILPSFVDCTKIIVDVRKATNFAGADTSKTFYTNPSMQYCTGGPGDTIIVRAVYPMPVYLTIFSISSLTSFGANTAGQTNYGGGMKHMLMGTAAFRNEPFATTASLPGC